MQRNLKIGYFLALANELYLPIAIWLLFYLKYLDFTQVAIIGALSTISSNLFEIPTGAISDLIGRKWTLFFSFLLSSLGLVIISSGNVFIVFAIGRVISGLGVSLFSGTHESLMYDTAKSLKKEHTYDSIVAKIETTTWIGLFIASIIGGIIYDYWNLGPFIISAVIYALAAILCLFIEEPKIDSEIFNFNNYVKQNLKGFQELFQNNRNAITSLLMITIASGYFYASKILGISQAEEYGLSGSGIGFLFGIGYIFAALASHFYPQLNKKFGNKRLLIIAVLALLSSFLFAPFVGKMIGSFLIILRISSSTTFGNAKSIIMNRLISSKNRATALSTLTLLSQIPFTLSFYFVGRYIDSNSPNNFALILGGILLVTLFPQLAIIIKQFKVATKNLDVDTINK